MRFLPRVPPLFALAGAVVLAVTASGFGQQPDTAEVTVLSRKEHRVGSHSIIVEEIAPPAVLPSRSEPEPEVRPTPPIDDHEPQKEAVVFFCFATVGSGVTELQGTHEGAGWGAVSSIDFNHLSGLAGFETDETAYTLLLVVVNANGESAPADGSVAWSSRGQESSWTHPRGEPPPPVVGDALDALHAYYDVHRDRLAEEHEQRLQEKEARERDLREHPPKKPDTLIRFWRMPPSAVPHAGERSAP